MCGIAGWIGFDNLAPELATQVAAELRHRGPDAQAVRRWPTATLIHTRLSIIDLAPTGAQPMANEASTVWVVFNGEIYNHHHLRSWLLGRGHKFQGRADSEVLPHLYEEEDIQLLGRLRGMYAFAIYDTVRRRLLLARDRFGIKPLYYSASRDRLAFASNLNALRVLPWVDIEPNRQAIHDFAALSYIPAPETFYRGIRSLEPGEYLVAQEDKDEIRWEVHRYHSWSVVPNQELTLKKAIVKADGLVQDAVTSQLESDVPLGTLLSGGIDSSLVSEAAQHGARGGVATFNVRFSDAAYDETESALMAARAMRSSHTTLDMDSRRGDWEQIEALLLYAGQPFADTSLFAVHAVSRLMRRHVTVALSGDGGDEAFGGYESYRLLGRVIRWQRLHRGVQSAALVAGRIFARGQIVPARLVDRLQELLVADDVGILEVLQRWVRGEEHARLCRGEGLLPVRRFFEPRWDLQWSKASPRLERLSALNTEINVRLRMANDYLFKVDAASMKESLEVRVPLLDEELFAFGMTLPHRLRVDKGMCKPVLRGVAARRLPERVARKPKAGFAVPVDSWVTPSFRDRYRDCILSPTARVKEYFNTEAYRPIVEAFCNRTAHPEISRAGIYQRAIMLLAVELHLQRAAAPRH
jgi:asparagine synthase (glutamine-hydrolysing)